METKAVAESDVPKTEASAIKETAEGVIPAKDRESTKCDFLDIAVSKIVIVYDVKNGKKVKNESDSISTNLTKLAQVIDIPVKYDLTGKCNPLIVRYHNGKAEAFQRLYAAPAKDALKDGTYYVEGAGENAIVHIYTDRFSIYALLTSGTEEYPRPADEDDGGKDGDSATVYRLYYAATREHFYTTGLHEKNTLVEKYGWIYEGNHQTGLPALQSLHHRSSLHRFSEREEYPGAEIRMERRRCCLLCRYKRQGYGIQTLESRP
jgi:hypothetical protein